LKSFKTRRESMNPKVATLMQRCRWKGIASLVCSSLLLSGVTVAALIGGGVDDPNGAFQLDGNATTDTTGFSATTDDWDKALGVVPGGHSIANTGVVVDLTNTTADNEFTGGSSKDIYDVSQWQWNTSKPQGKDDIAHAFAAAYTLPNGHTAVYFGLDRYDGSGDATAGFWFFQDGTVATNNVKRVVMVLRVIYRTSPPSFPLTPLATLPRVMPRCAPLRMPRHKLPLGSSRINPANRPSFPVNSSKAASI
jgi:hypothetical protein